MRAECKKCGHEWTETGTSAYYKCPECETLYARAALPHPSEPSKVEEAPPDADPSSEGPSGEPPSGEAPSGEATRLSSVEPPVAPPPRKPRPQLARLDRPGDERPRIRAVWVVGGGAVAVVCVIGWLLWSWGNRRGGWELTDEPPLYGCPGVDEILAADYGELKGRAEAGDAEAQYAMGVRWAHGEKYVHKWDIEGMARADIEARSREYFGEAAQQGYPPAQTVLAVDDSYPRLANRGPTEEPRRMREAAEKAYPPAWYVRGLWAVHTASRLEDEDSRRALKDEGLAGIERAALAGHAAAEHWVAIAHWCGLHGFDRDEEAATKWMTGAASDGSETAREQVVDLYARYLTVPDPAEAWAWASAGGAGESKQARKLKAGLSKVQAARAELRADELRTRMLPLAEEIQTPGYVSRPRLEDLDCGKVGQTARVTRRVSPPVETPAATADPDQRRVARDATCGDECVTAWIGPDGGEVALPDGTAVLYAPGALSQIVEVTLQPGMPGAWEHASDATAIGSAMRVHEITEERPSATVRVPVPGGIARPRGRDFVLVYGRREPTGGMDEDGTLWDGERFVAVVLDAGRYSGGTVSFRIQGFPGETLQAYHWPESTREVTTAGDESSYLTVNCKPWCHVRLDGEYLGSSPLKKQIIAPGSHSLELECGTCPERPSRTRRFNVRAGETYTSVRNEFDP